MSALWAYWHWVEQRCGCESNLALCPALCAAGSGGYGACQKDRRLQWADLGRLPYLQAVIKARRAALPPGTRLALCKTRRKCGRPATLPGPRHLLAVAACAARRPLGAAALGGGRGPRGTSAAPRAAHGGGAGLRGTGGRDITG